MFFLGQNLSLLPYLILLVTYLAGITTFSINYKNNHQPESVKQKLEVLKSKKPCESAQIWNLTTEDADNVISESQPSINHIPKPRVTERIHKWQVAFSSYGIKDYCTWQYSLPPPCIQ